MIISKRTILIYLFTIFILLSLGIPNTQLQVQFSSSSKVISVKIRKSNASAQDIERLITEPVEKQFIQLKMIKDMFSISQSGESVIRIEYDENVSSVDAYIQVKELLDYIYPQLPSDVHPPIIQEFDFLSLPVFSVAIRENDENIINEFADQLKLIPGVGKVNTYGVSIKKLQVYFDKDQALDMELQSSQLSNIFSSNDIIMSLLQKNNTSIIFDSRLKSIDDINNIVLRKGVLLKDIADVSYTNIDFEQFSRVNSDKIYVVDVSKSPSNSTIIFNSVIRKVLRKYKDRFSSQILYDEGTILVSQIIKIAIIFLIMFIVMILVSIIFSRFNFYSFFIALAGQILVFGGSFFLFSLLSMPFDIFTFEILAFYLLFAYYLIYEITYNKLYIYYARKIFNSIISSFFVILLGCFSLSIFLDKAFKANITYIFIVVFSSFWLTIYLFFLTFPHIIKQKNRYVSTIAGSLIKKIFIIIILLCIIVIVLSSILPVLQGSTNRVGKQPRIVLEFESGVSLSYVDDYGKKVEHLLLQNNFIDIVTLYEREKITLTTLDGKEYQKAQIKSLIKLLREHFKDVSIIETSNINKRYVEVLIVGNDDQIIRDLMRQVVENVTSKINNVGVLYYFKSTVKKYDLVLDNNLLYSYSLSPEDIYQQLFIDYKNPVLEKIFILGDEMDISIQSDNHLYNLIKNDESIAIQIPRSQNQNERKYAYLNDMLTIFQKENPNTVYHYNTQNGLKFAFEVTPFNVNKIRSLIKKIQTDTEIPLGYSVILEEGVGIKNKILYGIVLFSYFVFFFLILVAVLEHRMFKDTILFMCIYVLSYIVFLYVFNKGIDDIFMLFILLALHIFFLLMNVYSCVLGIEYQDNFNKKYLFYQLFILIALNIFTLSFFHYTLKIMGIFFLLIFCFELFKHKKLEKII